MSFPQKIRTPELLARPDSEWRRLIDQIEDYSLRCRVASIVWWDYASESDALVDLVDDGILFDSLVISDDRIAVELERIGYPHHILDARLKKADNEAWRSARTREIDQIEQMRKELAK